MTDVLFGALRSLLMYQVEIIQSRFLVRRQFEQDGRGSEFVGGRDRIVARTGNCLLYTSRCV